MGICIRRCFIMTTRWPLQEAKNRLSTVVDEALEHGPQIITRRGREAVVVLSIEEYKKMTGSSQNLVGFFRSSPLHSVEIDLTRDKDLPREVEL
jgi:antitoxin Phd